MLSACSWEGIALQREQFTADIHRAHSETGPCILACPGQPAAGGWSSGQRRRQTKYTGNLALGAALGQCWPRQTGIFWTKPKWAG